MYQQFTDKIKAIEAEINQTNARLLDCLPELGRQKSILDNLEVKLLAARKACALDNNQEKRDAVANLGSAVTKAKKDYDNLHILNEALKDKKAALELELKSATEALRKAETTCMVSKAQGLVDEYDRAIREAHKAATYLSIMVHELQQRGEMNSLKETCPVLSNLSFLASHQNFATSNPLDPQRPYLLLAGQYTVKDVLTDLIA